MKAKASPKPSMPPLRRRRAASPIYRPKTTAISRRRRCWTREGYEPPRRRGQMLVTLAVPCPRPNSASRSPR